MSLSGKPPARGVYCPACGDVRRVKTRSGEKEIRIFSKTNEVIVYPHVRGALTSMRSDCPGGRASWPADRAP